jgi:uncharacterized glyoxalase superfamily protein PhnB
MARGEVFPIINCTELGPAREFYERVFGGTLQYRFPPEGEGDAVYLTLAVGSGQIALGLGTGPAMYGETPLPATGHAVDICLYVADLQAVVDAAASSPHGGAVVVPPQDMPWGERVAYVRDPAGTMLLVIQDE